MRRAAPFVLLLPLAGCAEAPDVPPSVSYRVPGHNVAITGEEAQNYCLQFNRGARYQGVQETPTGLVAVYTCEAPGEGTAPAPAK